MKFNVSLSYLVLFAIMSILIGLFALTTEYQTAKVLAGFISGFIASDVVKIIDAMRSAK